MSFLGGFFKKLFNNGWDELPDFDDFSDGEFEWDWDHIIEERQLFKMSDDVQREKYIRSLVEQVKDASVELDKLSAEYNSVTATLKDMDEIEALPIAEKMELQDAARKILYYEESAKEYEMKKTSMSESKYRAMERFEDNMPKAYNDLFAAEEYRVAVKEDLKKLDSEKHAYLYRQSELTRDKVNYKGMVIVCVFAAFLCIVMLLVLQYGFEMDTQVGYIITVLALALSVTLFFVKYQDADKELKRVQKSINRIILLQNTVKIRYVNNTNLLDYLYTKYNTSSSKDLKRTWDIYLEEKALRERYAINEQEMSFYKQDLLKMLRKYQLNDVYAWLHNPLAILEHNEMVELRHAHILQRQKLRARMDYNKRLAKDGESELREFIKMYPEYSKEALDMLERYS